MFLKQTIQSIHFSFEGLLRMSMYRAVLLTLLWVGGFSFSADALLVKDIVIHGAQRIERETILSYLPHKMGEDFTEEHLNTFIKDLFKTGLFEDVQAHVEGANLVIKISENPIINQLAFEGNKKITDDILKSEVQIKPRDTYTRRRVQQGVLRLLDIYRVRKGMFSASVTPKVIRLPENRVDLIFEIKEGPVTRVKNICFQGVQAFGASTLKSAIYTQEDHWWRFFVTDDIFDKERLEADKDALRRFYMQHGYADVQIKAAFAELASDRSAFSITFVIDEGERYKVSAVDVVSDLAGVPLDDLRQKVTIKAGQWYNAETSEKLGYVLTEFLGKAGHPFGDARPRVEKNHGEHTLKLTYQIYEGSKTYVERVDIYNNPRTLDEVIRREVQIAEGDALNPSKVAQTQKKIQDLGFFNHVDIAQEGGSLPDRSVLKVKIDERSTGEIGLGAGGSSVDGFMGKVFFHESNFLGRGQDITIDMMVARRRKDLEFSFTEPYFMARPLVFGIDASHTRTNRKHETGFIHHKTGARVRLGYQVSEPLGHQVFYSLYRDRIDDISPSASLAIQEQSKTSLSSAVGHDLFYDQRDSKIDPSSGYYLSGGQDLAGLGGTVKYLRHRVSSGIYYPVTEKLIASFKTKVGFMRGLGGRRVRIIDRFFLGGPLNLRGFEYEGIGPRDTASGNALGGLNSYQISGELTFPITAGKDFNLKGHGFMDGGSVWSAQQPLSATLKDENKIRLSAGLGISFRVPMLGDIGLFLSRPLKKQPYDQTQPFQFRLGRFF